MYHNQWKMWVYGRRNQPLKLHNFPQLKKFAESIHVLSEKHNVNYVFCDVYRAIHLEHTLMYRSGSPNFQLFKLTPGGDYIWRNPRYDLWKNIDIDDGIIDRFLAMPNNRYRQPEAKVDVPEKFDLYLMQLNGSTSPVALSNNHHWIDGELKDDVVARQTLRYVKEAKRYTVFKAHPTTTIPSRTVWETYRKEGLISEYSIFIDECNTDYLVNKAERIYSADSAVSLNAMLLGKPVATYHDMDLSEILPQIKIPNEIENVEPVNREDLKRFLSWYYHKLAIDIEVEGFEEKIERFMLEFKSGKRTKEMFG